MSKFSHFAVKKLYFKRSFNNIGGDRGRLFSQINFDQTYFGGFCLGVFCPGGLGTGVFVQGFCPGGLLFGELCPRTRFSISMSISNEESYT